MNQVDPRRATPTDDAGARTADLYHWQAAMAATDGLALLTRLLSDDWSPDGGEVASIVCEHHEDWMIDIDGSVELVSAKHREATTGPWSTIPSLINDGGIGHLFARWLTFGQSTASRLVSSAAASKAAAGLGRCTELARRRSGGSLLSDDESALLDEVSDASVRAIMVYKKNLPPSWCAADGVNSTDIAVSPEQRATFQSFLTTLVLDLSRPSRDVIQHAAANMYVVPLLTTMQQPITLASMVWDAILPLFEARMRARGPAMATAVPVVAPSVTGWPESNVDLEPKTIGLRDLLFAVRTVIANPMAYAPLARPATTTKLSMKLAQGGCSETSIARAERLRMDYVRYRRARERNVPGSRAERGTIERTLHRIADEEAHISRSATGRWGHELWHALSTRLQTEPLDVADNGLDGDLALGGICELTSRCEIWFSSYFDVSATIKSELAARSIR